MRNKKQDGFLEVIVIILVALILLRFLDVDISSVLNNVWVKEFFAYVKEMLILVWQDLKEIFKAVKNG